MIIFTWTLTPNQVLALRAVEEHQRAQEAAWAEKKSSGIIPLGGDDIRNWFSSTRGLFREGFIRTREVPRPKWETHHTGKTMNKWEITEKGKLMLKLVAMEVDQQQRFLGTQARELKRLKSPKQISA